MELRTRRILPPHCPRNHADNLTLAMRRKGGIKSAAQMERNPRGVFVRKRTAP